MIGGVSNNSYPIPNAIVKPLEAQQQPISERLKPMVQVQQLAGQLQAHQQLPFGLPFEQSQEP